MRNYYREVRFRDKNHNIVELEIRIEDGRLSIMGTVGDYSGQVAEHIVPKNEAQERLLEIWKQWHNNDLHPGTERQEKAIEKWKKENGIKYATFKDACTYLKRIGLYEDNGYVYGSKWLKRELPKDIIETIEKIADDIEHEDRFENIVKAMETVDKIVESIETENDKTLTERFKNDEELYSFIKGTNLFDEEQIPIVMLFCHELGLYEEDLEHIFFEENNIVEVAGTTYLAGTDQEMEDYYTEYLESYLDEHVYSSIPEQYRKYFDKEEWIENAKSDGCRADALASYDGKELYFSWKGVDYYAYRQ